MVVISVCTYGVKIIKKFRWESGFLGGGSMEPPLCTNGSAGYLMQLSVKLQRRKSDCTYPYTTNHPKMIKLHWGIWKKITWQFCLDMSISLAHKNSTGVTPNCLWLVLGQSRVLTLPKLFEIFSRIIYFSGKISQNHATELTPEHAGIIDRNGERFSHKVCCNFLCIFPRCQYKTITIEIVPERCH